jgi:purine catabolism regulator
MGKVANPGPVDGQRVPTAAADGVPLSRVLATASLAGSRVIAGASGTGRVVTRLNVMEVPDIHAWVRPGELLLTTGYPVRDDPGQLVQVLEGLAERGVAALGIKLGRYLDALPDAVLTRADELGLPVVALGEHVSFDDVLTEVMTEVLTEQVARRAGGAVRTDHVHRVLVDLVLAGGDLASVAGSLAQQLDVVVLVTSPDGRVLATGGDPDGLRAVAAGPWQDRTGRLRTEDAAGALGLHAPVDGVSWAVAEIGAAGLDHGRLAAFSATRVLDDDDLVAVQRSATVCALVVTRELAVAAVEDRYRADYLRDLLHGRAGGDRDVVAHGEALGWDVDRPLVVVVLEPDPPATDDEAGPDRARRPVVERQASALAGAVRQRDAGAAVAALRTETVALVGVPPDGDVRRMVRDLVGVVRGAGGGGRKPFGVGVSRVCEGAAGLAAGYEQARTAVRVGRQVHGPSACTHFDDLGVYRLLSLVPDERELEAFAAETLGELAGPGEAAADLRRTLEVLLETSINVAETSRRLHFHYNTLRYRIGKLERVVGPFTTDPTLRLDLALALKVVAMRGLRSRSQ